MLNIKIKCDSDADDNGGDDDDAGGADKNVGPWLTGERGQ